MLTGWRHRLRIVEQTAVYRASAPSVTVMLILRPGHEQGAIESLASAASSVYDELELFVLDVSGTHPPPAVRRFLDDHPSLPIALLRRHHDGGIADSRNVLAKRARGRYVLALEPGASVYPSTLQRLADALDADPGAAFSYPMVGAYQAEEPVALLSSMPWEPERLRQGNWIDGIALIRRDRLLALGGYNNDPRLSGWEDFYLWCRFAAEGDHGVHVPQVLGSRRMTADQATPEKWALMRELFPTLLPAGAAG